MRTRVTTTVVVLATAGALALTGCSSSGGKKSSGGGLGGGSSAAGGGSSSAAAGGGSGKTIKIGFEGPLSGANAQLGINEEYGAEIAVDQANKDSSLGFKVQLVKSDDEGDPTKSPAAATAADPGPDDPRRDRPELLGQHAGRRQDLHAPPAWP